jgi:hypothetical protein
MNTNTIKTVCVCQSFCLYVRIFYEKHLRNFSRFDICIQLIRGHSKYIFFNVVVSSEPRICEFCSLYPQLTLSHSWRPPLHPQPEDAPCCGDKGPTYHNLGHESSELSTTEQEQSVRSFVQCLHAITALSCQAA